MKIFSLLAAAACITALSVPASARAEEESGGAWSIDGTVTLASDYRFRGYSLTDKKPAVQPELWVRHDSGLYAGFWGSNVSGLGGDDIEFDPAVGYSGSLGPVDVDLWAMWYLYPGASANNYAELGAEASLALGAGTIGLELGYAPAQDHIGGTDNSYAALKAAMPLGGTPISVDGSFGIEDGAFADRKLDWSLGLSAELGKLELGAHYIDAAHHGHDPLANATVVGTITYSF